jgi:excisionase family DNA binding protein
VRAEVVTADVGISVQEAAEAYGVSEKTIRRRIKSGQLRAFQVPTAQGHEWRITGPAPAPAAPGVVEHGDGQAPAVEERQLARPEPEPALLRALEIIREQQGRIAELEERNRKLVAEASLQRGRSEGYEREIADKDRQLSEVRGQLLALAPPAGASRRAPTWWVRARSRLLGP